MVVAFTIENRAMRRLGGPYENRLGDVRETNKRLRKNTRRGRRKRLRGQSRIRDGSFESCRTMG